MSEELAFLVKDALIDAFESAVEAAAEDDPLYGVDVHPSWPVKGVQGERSILVLDFEGDEEPATMRAGGGTYDDTMRFEVAVAVWAYESDASAVRALAQPISDAVKAIIRAEGAAKQGGCFGVQGVRQPKVRGYKVREYVLDKGRRECDVHLTLQLIGRNAAA